MEQGIALYARQHHHSHALLYGQDPGVTCLSGAALVLWYLGYPDQAFKKSNEALTLAQELPHPFSLAFALIWAGQLHQLRWEVRFAQERAEALMVLADEQGFAEVLAMGIGLRGWALVEQGQGEEGITEIRRSLEAFRAIEVELWRSYAVVLLAEMYGKEGQAEEGLNVLTEALAVVDKNESRWYEAELYRLKGELTLAQSGVQSLASRDQKEVEECFWKAIKIARRQQAKSLELRAVVSLSRLWQQQGRRDEARQMLAEVYGWFTEGFDTADLQEAKALLAALAK